MKEKIYETTALEKDVFGHLKLKEKKQFFRCAGTIEIDC
jgi:hypothetical protein